KWGNGKTPESEGTKGDHFVGEFYVRFEKELRKEYLAWQESAHAQEVFDHTAKKDESRDRKSTRLNSSHVKNSYAVFCVKKKRMSSHDGGRLDMLLCTMSMIEDGDDDDDVMNL